MNLYQKLNFFIHRTFMTVKLYFLILKSLIEIDFGIGDLGGSYS